MVTRKRWIELRYGDLNIRSIERKIGCSRGTIQKWIKSNRSFPTQAEIMLERYIEWLVSTRDEEFVKFLGEEKDYPGDSVIAMGLALQNKKREDSYEKEINIQQNTSIISEDGKDVINSLPEIFDRKQGYKNMKRLEPNINYNGEVYEVYIYKEGKFEYCYSNDIDNARYILESLKNK